MCLLLFKTKPSIDPYPGQPEGAHFPGVFLFPVPLLSPGVRVRERELSSTKKSRPVAMKAR